LGGQSAPGVDPYIDTLSVSDMSELARRMSSVRKNEELRARLEAMPCAWVLVLDQDTEHEAVYSTTVGEDDERVVIAFEDDADAKNYAEGFQDKLLSESVEPATSVTLQALDLEALVVSSREADFRVAVVFKGDVYSQNEEDTDDEVGTGIDAHEESVDGSVGRSVARIFSDSGGMEQLSLDADLDDDGDDVDDDDDDDDFEEYFEFTLGGELPLITSGLRDIDADAGSWRVAYTVLPDEMFADKTSADFLDPMVDSVWVLVLDASTGDEQFYTLAINGTDSLVCFKSEAAAHRCRDVVAQRGGPVATPRAVLLEDLLFAVDEMDTDDATEICLIDELVDLLSDAGNSTDAKMLTSVDTSTDTDSEASVRPEAADAMSLSESDEGVPSEAEMQRRARNSEERDFRASARASLEQGGQRSRNVRQMLARMYADAATDPPWEPLPPLDGTDTSV